MTQEETDLLFKDLCGRLPYGVKGKYQYSKDESRKPLQGSPRVLTVGI